MMPRIDAGEQLAAYERAVLADGMRLENDLDRQRTLDALRRRAVGAPPPEPVKADPADLAGMGIGIANADDLPAIGDLNAWLGNPEEVDG